LGRHIAAFGGYHNISAMATMVSVTALLDREGNLLVRFMESFVLFRKPVCQIQRGMAFDKTAVEAASPPAAQELWHD
jgi:hypothetical protein